MDSWGPVYGPALGGQFRDMEVRWRRCLPSSDSRCWLDPEHSCHCSALAVFHCLLLILPVPDAQVWREKCACAGCGAGAACVPSLALSGMAVSEALLASPSAQLPAWRRWKGRAASAKPESRQSPYLHRAGCQQSRWPCGSSKALAAGSQQGFNHC